MPRIPHRGNDRAFDRHRGTQEGGKRWVFLWLAHQIEPVGVLPDVLCDFFKDVSDWGGGLPVPGFFGECGVEHHPGDVEGAGLGGFARRGTRRHKVWGGRKGRVGSEAVGAPSAQLGEGHAAVRPAGDVDDGRGCLICHFPRIPPRGNDRAFNRHQGAQGGIDLRIRGPALIFCGWRPFGDSILCFLCLRWRPSGHLF